MGPKYWNDKSMFEGYMHAQNILEFSISVSKNSPPAIARIPHPSLEHEGGDSLSFPGLKFPES